MFIKYDGVPAALNSRRSESFKGPLVTDCRDKSASTRIGIGIPKTNLHPT
ncbi:hypothetical protein PAGU2595_028420 [Lysobacter xanthus]